MPECFPYALQSTVAALCRPRVADFRPTVSIRFHLLRIEGGINVVIGIHQIRIDPRWGIGCIARQFALFELIDACRQLRVAIEQVVVTSLIHVIAMMVSPRSLGIEALAQEPIPKIGVIRIVKNDYRPAEIGTVYNTDARRTGAPDFGRDDTAYMLDLRCIRHDRLVDSTWRAVTRFRARARLIGDSTFVALLRLGRGRVIAVFRISLAAGVDNTWRTGRPGEGDAFVNLPV